MRKKGCLLTTALALMTLTITAQDFTAPYSIYGVGDLDRGYYDRSAGMAGTSMALKTAPFYMMNKNPASLAGLERSWLQVNGSFVGKTVTYKGTPINTDNANTRDFSVKNFSVGIKLNNFWASGLTIQPFSYVNYYYNSKKAIGSSTESYDVIYEGDGGLYNVSWNNAFSLGKHFSFGVRTSVIFGSINKSEILQSEIAQPVTTKTTDWYSNFRFEYGGIYSAKMSKNWKFSIGGKFSAKTKLDATQSLLITQPDASGNIITLKEDEYVKEEKFHLPVTYDVGIALVNRDRLTFAVDYKYEDWASLEMKGTGWSLINSHRLSAGFQLSNQLERWGLRMEKSYFQAGLFTGRSYLRVKNTPLDEFGGTMGFGSYLSGKLSYGISLEAGRRGTMANNLIKENYVQLTLSLSFREFLFSKGRKYD